MKKFKYDIKLYIIIIASFFVLIIQNICYANETISTCPAPNLLYKTSFINGKSQATFDTSQHWQTLPNMITLHNVAPDFASTIQFKSVTIDHIYSPDPNSSDFFIQINCHYIFKNGQLFTAYQVNNAKTYSDHWWKDTGDNGPYPFSACGIPIESPDYVPVSFCQFIIVPQ